MATREKPATEFDAPQVWQLWHYPDVESDGWETLLYSDSMICGEPYPGDAVSLGPCMFFPTAAEPEHGQPVSGQLVLRLRRANPRLRPGRPLRSPQEHYLDLGPDDEVAALLSLLLGVRLRSGGLIRRFVYGGDPAGEPELHDHRPPALIPVPERRQQLLGLRGREAALADVLPQLKTFPQLHPTDAVTIVKAARSYADALWVADNDPQQAWLHLVTALETAAVNWQTTDGDALESSGKRTPSWSSC